MKNNPALTQALEALDTASSTLLIEQDLLPTAHLVDHNKWQRRLINKAHAGLKAYIDETPIKRDEG